MSHLVTSVNNIKSSSNSNIDLALSSLITASASDVLGIDASGDAKTLTPKSEVGEMGLSCIAQQGGWSGSATINDGFQLRMRGNSSLIEENTSLVTKHTQGGAAFLIGFTVQAGNYLFTLNNCVDTNGGGNCNAQVYDATNSAFVGPKVHFETGNFSTTLFYYASVASATRFELRALDVAGSCVFFNDVSMFSCTFNIFKV